MQRELEDGTERIVETQDRIGDLKQQINAKYEQVLQESAVDLEQVASHEFVRLVARLYERMGYDVARTPRSRDGGVDLYARKTNEAGDEQHLVRGVLVTSGSFSDWCRSFAEGKRIDLIDRERLCELLEHYQVR